MANVSIFGLGALGAAPATNDLLVLVDSSDTSQSPNGSTKKMTVANLFTSPALSAPVITSGVTVTGTAALAATTATNLILTSPTAPFHIVNSTGSAASYNGFADFTRGAVACGNLVADSSDNLVFSNGAGNPNLTLLRATQGVTVTTLLAVSGNLVSTTGITSTGPTGAGVGYAAGAGGSVTQITSATTAVTLDKLTGRITTFAQNLAAGVTASFTVNNSAVTATDIPVVYLMSGQSFTSTVVKARLAAAGSFIIDVISGGSTETGALVIGFYIAKGAIT